jgi:hypothetical protein
LPGVFHRLCRRLYVLIKLSGLGDTSIHSGSPILV